MDVRLERQGYSTYEVICTLRKQMYTEGFLQDSSAIHWYNNYEEILIIISYYYYFNLPKVD